MPSDHAATKLSRKGIVLHLYTGPLLALGESRSNYTPSYKRTRPTPTISKTPTHETPPPYLLPIAITHLLQIAGTNHRYQVIAPSEEFPSSLGGRNMFQDCMQ